MFQFSANLYRIVHLCSSKEETRYYLGGVFVEPAKGRLGVTMTATDGHRLLTLWDEHGTADESAIIKLSDFALKACKGRNIVRIETDSDVARVYEIPKYLSNYNYVDIEMDGLPVVAQCGIETKVVTSTRFDDEYGIECQVTQRIRGSESCKIDGCFPDYRRVTPTLYSAPQWGAWFNTSLIEAFGKIGAELAKHFECTGQFRLLSNDMGGPALIRFDTDKAFGVLMPMRGNDDSVGVPEWFAEPPPVAQITYQEAA